MPVCEANTQRRFRALKKVKPFSGLLADGILEPKAGWGGGGGGGGGCGRQNLCRITAFDSK